MPNKSAAPPEAALQTEPETCTGATAVMRCLLAEGATLIFGYPGGAIMPVYDALYDYQHQIKHILVRHEQGAIHAAEGYARATGKPGIVLATSGPGATNLVTGLADALMDSVPLVCIVGQVHSSLLGTDAFQEANVMSITRSVTKWNYQITCPDEIPGIMAKAFHIAREGKPGPVLIEITKDAQAGNLSGDFLYPGGKYNPVYPVSALAQDQLHAAAQLLQHAKQPLILAGNGVGLSGACTELLALAELLDVPVACTLHGLSSFPSDHRLYAGMLGMHGNYAPNMLTNQADLILAIGMRFDDRVTGNLSRYALKAKIIHIEIDPSEINKIVPATIALQGDARYILQALLPLLHQAKHTDWIASFHAYNETEYTTVRQKMLHNPSAQISMAEVIHRLSHLTDGKALMVADVGQHQMITALYYSFRTPGSYLTSGGLGTMGYALPAAMGAKLGRQDRDVIAVIGDGCFQMTLQELATIAQYDIPVRVIVLDNNYLGMVRQWQSLFFDNRYSSVSMVNPDFSAVAGAFGIASFRVTEREKLIPALEAMLTARGPFLLHIQVAREHDVFPMIPPGAAVDEIRLH